jgi:hypothetical protein
MECLNKAKQQHVDALIPLPLITSMSTTSVNDFLQQNNVNVMNWPALNPDLNPIEHLWDEIQRRLNEEQPSPTTAAELSVAFQTVWAHIPIVLINRLKKRKMND